MNLSVCRSFACLSMTLALTSVIALPGSCQQKKPKRAAHAPVEASRKTHASVTAFQAAFSGDLVKLTGIVSSGGSIRMQDKVGKTLLHHAVLGGRVAVVRWLVSQKIPLNTTDASGVSALAFALQSTSDSNLEERRAEIINFLQEEGAQEIGKAPALAQIAANPETSGEAKTSGNRSEAGTGSASKAAPAAAFKIFSILGKKKPEIDKLLGAPTRVSKYHSDISCFYERANCGVEVFLDDHIATSCMVWMPIGTSWNAALTAVGINPSNIKAIRDDKLMCLHLSGPELKGCHFWYFPRDEKMPDGTISNSGLPYLDISDYH